MLTVVSVQQYIKRMAHAKKDHLKHLNIMLTEIRKTSELKEKSFGCFYIKSKSVLHFHVKDTRLYAHVYDGKGWIEVDLKGSMPERSQKQISKKIIELLPI